MRTRRKIHKVGSGWLAALLVAVIAGIVALSLAAFNQSFSPTVPVTLTADRSGLVMEPYAQVKMRGVQVGRVAAVTSAPSFTSLRLEISPDQIKYIPANVQARISATSLFGPKFVDLITPNDPSPQRLAAGTVLRSQNVAVEVNTVFQNVVELIKQIDPYKLNAILAAFADGLRGQGQQLGEAITDSKVVFAELNSRTETIRQDLRAVKGVSDIYSVAAPHIIDTLAAVSTTSATISAQAHQLDALLLSIAGLSRSGIALLGPSEGNLIKAVNTLQPTTSLLMKYNPELTCMLVGAKTLLDPEIQAGYGYADMLAGANGKSLVMDATLMFGDDPYRYPDNLPVTAAKGGPGGKPGCGSLPDVAKDWPVRYLITDTGFGTGTDIRPNPGIGFPGYANYLPVTRGLPEPPSIRHPGPPALGPIPYPGAPPYGAPQYGPDGVPLYPGLPPAPPPGTPREAGPPPPGSEPFVPPYPAQMQPTYAFQPPPPPPPPQQGAAAPP